MDNDASDDGFEIIERKGKGKENSKSGGGSGTTLEDFSTPVDKAVVTKEELLKRMEKLQKDFAALEEEEERLSDSPAATVKKRKRRKSSGKGLKSDD